MYRSSALCNHPREKEYSYRVKIDFLSEKTRRNRTLLKNKY